MGGNIWGAGRTHTYKTQVTRFAPARELWELNDAYDYAIERTTTVPFYLLDPNEIDIKGSERKRSEQRKLEQFVTRTFHLKSPSSKEISDFLHRLNDQIRLLKQERNELSHPKLVEADLKRASTSLTSDDKIMMQAIIPLVKDE